MLKLTDIVANMASTPASGITYNRLSNTSPPSTRDSGTYRESKKEKASDTCSSSRRKSKAARKDIDGVDSR
jgi:hypothetical protein